MLTIRTEQIDALREGQLRDWLAQYLQSCYPARTGELGPAALADLVRGCYKQARKRGLVEPDQIRKYIHVAFILGSGFEQHFAWAAEILDNPDYKSDLARLRALEDAVVLHLKNLSEKGAQS